MLGEVKGTKIGSLRSRGLKPPAVKGHAAAFRYWLDAFGHSGPYKEEVRKDDCGKEVIIPSGNTMNSPGTFYVDY